MARLTASVATRLLMLVVVLFVISISVFLLVHLLPGNPAYAILGPGATPAGVERVVHELGLNKPLTTQYLSWFGRAVRGNLGNSYLTHQPVGATIGHAFPVDLELVILSQVIAFAIAIPMAVAAARHQGKWIDRTFTAGSFWMLSMPPFVIGVPLLLALAVTAHLFPATGYIPIYKEFLTNLHEMLLPSITLAIGSVAVYYRLLRSDLISTLQEEFVTLARSKGLSDRAVMYRHALRPSTIPLVTATAINVGSLLGGAVIVEYIFDLPGMGLLLVNGINSRDYMMVQGVILTLATAFVIINFLADILYRVIDPRVRHA